MSDERLTFPTRVIIPLMVEAHRKTAEALAFESKQRKAWEAAGKPRRKAGDNMIPDGYFVLGWMRLLETERWLVSLRSKIDFFELAMNDTIALDYKEFTNYTKAKFSLEGYKNE